MTIEVYIGREDSGDNIGKLFVHIGSEGSSGYKQYVDNLAKAAEEVKNFIDENFEDDGADICWKVN